MECFLTYALLGNELKHIDEVANGKACGCICPNCHESLIAKNNGTKKTAHFAHVSDGDCPGAYETALHLLAKKVLSETKRLRTPDFHFDYDYYNESSLFRRGSIIKFDSILIEIVPQSAVNREIIVDAMAILDGHELVVEFFVSHRVDENKTSKLINCGLACIEINLSGQPLNYTVLKKFLLSRSSNIYWICSPNLEKAHKNHLEKQRFLEEEARKQRELEEILRKNKQYNNQREFENKSQSLYEQYKAAGKCKFYTMKDGFASKCPILRDKLSDLKTKPFYRHSILKHIIDGEYWNGKVYENKFTRECRIFLSGKSVEIYPPKAYRDLMSHEQVRAANLLYAGIKTIEEILAEAKPCNHCNHLRDTLSIAGNYLSVCDYEDCKLTGFAVSEENE